MRTPKLGLLLAALALGSACSSDSPTAPNSNGGALTLGVAVTVSGATDSEKYFTVVVPAGAEALRVTLAGGSGDADLFVRFGAEPIPSAYDCLSASGDSNENCTFLNPTAGTWHIAIVGFDDYSGVQLKAETVAAPSITVLTSGAAQTNQSGAEGSRRYYRITVPAGATSLNVSTSGGTGDADLFLSFNLLPSNGSNDCSSEDLGTVESCTISSPTAGVWYIMLEGWTAYSGVTITATVT